MANTTITTVLANTDRKLVIKHTQIYTDAATQTDTVVDISASAYNSSGGKAMTGVAVNRVWAATNSDCTGSLIWVSDENAIFFGVVVDTASHSQDYTAGDWGGLTVEGTNATGDIALKTSSMASGRQVTTTIEMRKIF